MAQFLSQCTHMWLHWLLLGTCEYIDCNIEVNTRLSSKSQCTHMWLHWLLLSHWEHWTMKRIFPFICILYRMSCQVTRLRLVTWDFCITCDFQNPILTFPTHSIFTVQPYYSSPLALWAAGSLFQTWNNVFLIKIGISYGKD